MPEPTRRFLRTVDGRRVRDVVFAFHRWLIFKRVDFGRLTPYRLARFLERPARTELTVAQRQRYAEQLEVYLRWLWHHRLIAFDPTPRRRVVYPLPTHARAFLASLEPTLKPSTCAGYAHSLRGLHQWLDAHGLDFPRLTRHRLAPWFEHLHALGLAPATRLSMIINVRTYLSWLGERRALCAHSDDLVRRTDLPKLPCYLPRPLPPEIDRELQHRLANSEDPYARGLLLMRRTGLRVGELLRLEHGCLRSDGDAHRFLKVPLGKLYTERLVPLDEDTVALVRRLQASGAPNRPLLFAASGAASGSYERCRKVLRALCADLHDAAPITTHRLRHTYATELLNAGMSLVGLMQLLGHRDYRMTLRYAAITHATVGREYYQALDHLTAKYRLPGPPDPAALPDPRAMLDDLARWARQHALSASRLHRLLNRIARLQRDLERLPTSSSRQKPREE